MYNCILTCTSDCYSNTIHLSDLNFHQINILPPYLSFIFTQVGVWGTFYHHFLFLNRSSQMCSNIFITFLKS